MSDQEPDGISPLIPQHLLQKGRNVLPNFHKSEIFYRRFPFAQADVTWAISFDDNKNSVNLARLCKGPEDVLVKKDGSRCSKSGVLSIPLKCLHQHVWRFDAKSCKTAFEHAPLLWNYPHSNMVMFDENGNQIRKHKAGALKSRIREAIKKDLELVLPLSHLGHTFAYSQLNPSKSLFEPGMTLAPSHFRVWLRRWGLLDVWDSFLKMLE